MKTVNPRGDGKREPKTDSRNAACLCLLKIVFASLGAIHIRQRLGKVGDAEEGGGAHGVEYLSLFAKSEPFTSELPYTYTGSVLPSFLPWHGVWR